MYGFYSSQSYPIKQIIAIFFILTCSASYAMDVPIDDFSITPYSQTISDYLPPNDNDYSVSLLKPEHQKSQLQQFYTHYYSSDASGLSPWSDELVKSVLPIVKTKELELLDNYNNQNKPLEARHYGENFKEHDEGWWNKIRQNMDLNALDAIAFKAENKAIAVSNTMARGLPELAPDFHHASLPGEGFPFDNLQESAIWAGTPLYVISTSQDKAWSLVLTPDAYFAWVSSRDIAYVSGAFIHQWQSQAQSGLIAITETEASVLDAQQQFQFTGYIGAVFPYEQQQGEYTSILIPTKNTTNQAVIKTALVRTSAVGLMPLPASKKNFAKIIKQLKHRPYGWGGAFLYNDCSQEMKSIFTPFGIWLPRNSSNQARLNSTLDLSKQSVESRINALTTTGHPLMTIIFNGGHVMLYVGKNYKDNLSADPITYQNIWGLQNTNGTNRYVIGQSVFLPLIRYFPEQPDIKSQANRAYFKLIYLDALESKMDSPQLFARKFFR